MLMNPVNGVVTTTGRSPGSNAMYTCDSADYELVGDSVRECGDDGEWRGEPPMCICKQPYIHTLVLWNYNFIVCEIIQLCYIGLMKIPFS